MNKIQKHVLPLVRAKARIHKLLDGNNEEQIVKDVENTSNHAAINDVCNNKKNNKYGSLHCLEDECGDNY